MQESHQSRHTLKLITLIIVQISEIKQVNIKCNYYFRLSKYIIIREQLDSAIGNKYMII